MYKKIIQPRNDFVFEAPEEAVEVEVDVEFAGASLHWHFPPEHCTTVKLGLKLLQALWQESGYLYKP